MDYLSDIEQFTTDALTEQAKEEKDPGKAMERLLNKGIMPDGAKWMEKPRMKWKFDNAPVIKKENWDDKGDHAVYTVKFRVAPGKGGGGGIGVDPRATNQFFNLMGTDRMTLNYATKAYTEAAKKGSRALNKTLEMWIKKPEVLLEKSSYWCSKCKYKIEDVTFKNVSYEKAAVDPSRRRWPAGRTEVWVPVVADAVIKVKKKAMKEDVDSLDESKGKWEITQGKGATVYSLKHGDARADITESRGKYELSFYYKNKKIAGSDREYKRLVAAKKVAETVLKHVDKDGNDFDITQWV